MQKIDMSGEKPRNVWSLNLDSARLYLYIILGVITIVGAIFASVSWANGRMMTEPDRHIHDEIEMAVSPPGGMIYKAIDLAVERNNVLLNRRMDRSDREQNRQGGMTEQIYEKVTGLDPPPKVD